jgi:hypothetical protein
MNPFNTFHIDALKDGEITPIHVGEIHKILYLRYAKVKQDYNSRIHKSSKGVYFCHTLCDVISLNGVTVRIAITNECNLAFSIITLFTYAHICRLNL